MPIFRLLLSLFILFNTLNCFSETIEVISVADNVKDQDIFQDSYRQLLYNTKINYGITLQENETKTRYAYKPFIDYLSEKLKVNVRLIVMADYDSLEKDMERGIIHIADFPPIVFLNAKERMKKKLVYLATHQYSSNYGTDAVRRDYYQGFIFVKNDSKIKKLKDLKNKKIAFVEKSSTSGYQYPMAGILKAGINPETFFKRIFYVGSHEAVLLAIAKGSADAGATYDYGLLKYNKENDAKFRVVYKTPKIPNGAFCASSKLSQKLRKKIQRIVLKINFSTKTNDGRKVVDYDRGFTISGFVKKSIKQYLIVRETEKILNHYNQRRAK